MVKHSSSFRVKVDLISFLLWQMVLDKHNTTIAKATDLMVDPDHRWQNWVMMTVKFRMGRGKPLVVRPHVILDDGLRCCIQQRLCHAIFCK